MIDKIRDLQTRVGTSLQDPILLILRIFIGYGLFRAGYEKLSDLDQAAAIFEYLKIPAPKLNAILVGFFEAACGLCLMLGLLTRISSVIVIVILGVAVLTAHMGEVKQLFSQPGVFIVAAPMPYIFLSLVFGSFGPGRLSLDHRLGIERKQ